MVASVTDLRHGDAKHADPGRRTLRAAMFGFFVDMYDVYLPVVALAPAAGYFAPAGASTVEMATLTAAIFAVSLIGRPIGAIVFGVLGDRVGRRKTTVLVAAGFTICTGLIALLPGYSTIGLLAPVSLVALRLLDGIFLGGEYTAANPLAMEYAPREKRGVYGSLLNVGYPAALGSITVLTIVLLQILPSDGADSAYAVWGWRIPFVIGFVLSGAIFLYYLRSVPESEIWTKAEKPKKPLRILFAGRNLRRLGFAFLVGSGAWLTLDATVGIFASHFKSLGANPSVVNTAILISALVGIGMFPWIGAAGQRYGRRQVFLVLGAVNLVVAPTLLGLAVSGAKSTTMVLLCGCIVLLSTLAVWSVISAYLMELFPTEVRSSGYGIAYSLPSVIPALYPYYMIWLSGIMPYGYTPVVLLSAGGLFLMVGSWLSSDLRHIDLENA
ncbi:MFS family permease [Saccharopolyspora phatthalungensis]|uniref:MFS family permease n=2 Tax=Saccharopolyspora phatthalungensis TaxID=664693 RepID=A0A840QIJ9_9PSEU|nr:MFS family permease [Saccharopolyspora phatthalungensis]